MPQIILGAASYEFGDSKKRLRLLRALEYRSGYATEAKLRSRFTVSPLPAPIPPHFSDRSARLRHGYDLLKSWLAGLSINELTVLHAVVAGTMRPLAAESFIKARTLPDRWLTYADHTHQCHRSYETVARRSTGGTDMLRTPRSPARAPGRCP